MRAPKEPQRWGPHELTMRAAALNSTPLKDGTIEWGSASFTRLRLGTDSITLGTRLCGAFGGVEVLPETEDLCLVVRPHKLPTCLNSYSSQVTVILRGRHAVRD